MRIISKFHDYYDSAMGFGQDPGLVYRRDMKVQVIESRLWPGPETVLSALVGKPWPYDWSRALRSSLIGFCGRFYWMCYKHPLVVGLDVTTNKEVWLTDGQILEIETVLEDYRRESAWMTRRFGTREERVARTLSTVREAIASLPREESIFRALNAPVFLATCSDPSWDHGFEVEITTNPRLATLGFQHVLDPFSAFQEIAMFLGSALATEDQAPRTVGDDRTIASAKGFDDQSFRTQAPGSKKTNRKLNRERKKGPG